MRALPVLFLATAAAAQQPGPFSHEIHLQVHLSCTSCHTKAPESTAKEDNLLPDEKVCLDCHDEAAIKKPAPTLLSRFSHKRHVSLGNIAPVLRAAVKSGAYLSKPGDLLAKLDDGDCVACHRGLFAYAKVSKANFPQMADCRVCHNKVDPPFSCEFCHSKEMALKPANHKPDFIDTHTSKNAQLDKTTCAVCHDRKFTCLGCHLGAGLRKRTQFGRLFSMNSKFRAHRI